LPTYTFRGPGGDTTTRKLTFGEYDQVQSGALHVVNEVGQTLELVFNPAGVGFVLKDGPSGGWMSKAIKENGYRAQRGQTMSKREKDHVFKTKLIPNYQGAEASTWKDVREEARQKSGDAAASTYDSHVAKESPAP
jgi:hypothetical protein